MREHYEILDLIPGATPEEIDEAYRQALKIYGEDSPALYALFTAKEKESMIEKINEAYRALKSGAGEMDIAQDINPPQTAREINPSMFGRAESETCSIGRISSIVRLDKEYSPQSLDPLAIEQYRVLFARLERISSARGFRSYSITSSIKGEGKSVTALNLSYMMAAEFKKKTILVECDLRKPSTLSMKLESVDSPGLMNVLKGGCELSAAISRVEGTSLYILPAGPLERNSAEFLNSPQLANIIDRLKAGFDYVIVDSPPLLPLVDMNIISRLVDGLIAVVRAGKTPKDIVLKAFNSLPGANFLGVVLNGAELKMGRYYY